MIMTIFIEGENDFRGFSFPFHNTFLEYCQLSTSIVFLSLKMDTGIDWIFNELNYQYIGN